MQDEILQEKTLEGLEKFVPEFYQDRLSEMETLRIAYKEGDYEAIRKTSHRWKGFCAPYGFEILGKLSQDLELGCTNKDSERIKDIMQQMRDYLALKGKVLNLI